MNFSNRKHIIRTLIVCFLSIPILPIMANALDLSLAGSPYGGQSKTSILDRYRDALQKQLEEIHGILSDLSAIIYDGQVKTVRHKDQTIMNIQLLMRDIERKKNVLAVSADTGTIIFMSTFTEAVINHVGNALLNSMAHFGAFDSEQLLNNKSQKISNLESLHPAIKANRTALKKLIKQANNVGLRWYNKAYRAVDNNIFSHTSKYHLSMLGGSLFGMYLWWLWSINKNKPNIITTGNLSWLIGPSPEYNPLSGGITNKDNLGLLGNLEYTISGFMRSALPLGSILATYSWENIKSLWEFQTRPWLTKNLSMLHYRLKGGAYHAKANKIGEIIEEVTFDDLVGLDHVKEYFTFLVEYLENPEAYARRKLTPQKGCLLAGPTRTGKSHCVKALNGEINKMLQRKQRSERFTFLELPAALINYQGIKWCMHVLKESAPCIVFIDEIDLLNLQRSGQNQMLSEFLTSLSGALDETDPHKQVIIIAATNKPESLDFALRQPGRFGKELRFEYPNYNERLEYLKRKLNKLSLNLQNFSVEKLARETDGKSYEGLQTLVDHSVLKARLRGQSVTQEHLEEALDQEVRRVMLTNMKNIPDHEQEILAAHFAGHALALHLLNPHTKLAKVTINPVMTTLKEELIGKQLLQGAFGKKTKDDEQARYEYGCVFTYHEQDTVNIMSKEEKIHMCKMHLAGHAAEKIIHGTCSYSCHHADKEKALTLATSLTFEGLDPESLPKHIAQQRYDQAFALLTQCEQEITKLLAQHKESLINIAHELKQVKTLDAQEIKEIVQDTESDIV
ncbi:MAG TPA: AAA family ATPase [Candidatus Dependentiae bacterium]|nr:AAA family ATPase [Candidatus Dependentiae bacterium]